MVKKGDMTKRGFQIAIDGPVAAGKGTVSRAVAELLGFVYIDTGATYRAATLIAMRHNLSFEKLDRQEPVEVEILEEKLKQVQIGLRRPNLGEEDGRLITVLIDNEDVSKRIRDKDVSEKVPIVAKIPQVREVMVEKQRLVAQNADVVMEGRDITFRVLPEADLKIFLDARLEIRAERRRQELARQGRVMGFEDIVEDIRRRDGMDTTRGVDPLKRVDDAWYLDTSEMQVEEVVEAIVARVKGLSEESVFKA